MRLPQHTNEEKIEKLLGGKVFTFVDIGAKDGFKGLEKLHSFTDFFAFEPDENSFREISQNKNTKFRRRQLFQLALDESEGEKTFYVNAHRSMNSLLPFDEDIFDRHFGTIPGSQNWKAALQNKGKVKINTTTLDKFVEDQKIQRIDFLKLDTQGTELQILKGCSNLLQKHQISVLQTEVMQTAVYKGQALFSDIDIFLKQQGLDLVDYIVYHNNPTTHLSTNAMNSALLKGKYKWTIGGDCIYVLKKELLTDSEKLKTSLIMAHLGYFSEALYFYPYEITKDVEFIFAHLGAEIPSDKIKRFIKATLPPFLFDFLKKLK